MTVFSYESLLQNFPLWVQYLYVTKCFFCGMLNDGGERHSRAEVFIDVIMTAIPPEGEQVYFYCLFKVVYFVSLPATHADSPQGRQHRYICGLRHRVSSVYFLRAI